MMFGLHLVWYLQWKQLEWEEALQMEVLMVVLMVDLTMIDILSRILLMHGGFVSPYVYDHYQLVGTLVLIYVYVCRGRANVSGVVGIHRVDDIGGYIFQMVICYFLPQNSSKVLSYFISVLFSLCLILGFYSILFFLKFLLLVIQLHFLKFCCSVLVIHY